MLQQINGRPVSLDRRGSGTPVVLIHGIGSRWECFEPVIDLLAAHHDVLSLDLAGFGNTPVDERFPADPWGYAEWVTAVLDDLGIQRPHVAGSSMGGGIALELGRRGVADRVTAFAPIGLWGTPGRMWTQSLLTALRIAARHAKPVTNAALAHDRTRALALAPLFGHPGQVSQAAAELDVAGLAGAPAFRDARNRFGRYRLEASDDPGKLADIPVTIAWGTRDVVLIHRTQSAKARAVLPFAHHVDLPGCGHLPFSDDPKLCASVVLEEQGER